MKLEQLIGATKPLQVVGTEDKEITGVEIDSRQMADGKMFVAIQGTQADGHTYIEKAIEAGATAVACQQMPELLHEGVTYLQYADTEAVIGRLATTFYGNPTGRMKLVGVTGTNGKTTIATLLYRIFRRMGYKCGLCSTVCNYINDEAVPTECTTPDPVTLNRLLGQMADAGCEYAFMEVSSHSVVQQRIGGLTFAGGIFTNLTRDHLDYHKTFENYRDAKKGFFDALPKKAFAVVNGDDRNALFMLQNTRAAKYTYALKTAADYKAKILEESFEGMNLEMDGREVFVQFVGRFNASNLLAVYAATCLLGVDKEQALVELSAMTPVNGRFETIRSPKGVTAIVDYAHTPDAVENVINTINEIRKPGSRLITIVGCGGNRDKGKRPMMASLAKHGSDRLILTSDNPRDEEPADILKDMIAGLTEAEQRDTLIIEDREMAIRTACMMAEAGDVILVAGKGHEDYQIIKGVKHHFDDHEVVRKYM